MDARRHVRITCQKKHMDLSLMFVESDLINTIEGKAAVQGVNATVDRSIIGTH